MASLENTDPILYLREKLSQTIELYFEDDPGAEARMLKSGLWEFSVATLRERHDFSKDARAQKSLNALNDTKNRKPTDEKDKAFLRNSLIYLAGYLDGYARGRSDT